MAVKMSFVPLDNGRESRLTITGGEVGSHKAVIRSIPSGFPLRTVNWHHADKAVVDVPVEHESILVTVDDGHEHRLELTRNEPPAAKPAATPKKKGK